MLLLLITIFVILQRSCQGSEFVLLETEAEGDTGDMEDSEPARSSNGDYQDNPTMDVSNQDKFGCQDCNLDMTPMYGHTPCTGCEEGNPQGSPFSCRACVAGELQKFKCDDCQRNGNGRIEWVSVTKLVGFPSQFDHYAVNSHYEPYDLPAAEICEAVGMRSVCDISGRGHEKMCQRWKRNYELYKDTIKYRAVCANRASDNPNPRTGVYRLEGAENL